MYSRIVAWIKLTDQADERGNPSLCGPPQKSLPLNKHLIIPSLFFLLSLIDGILSTDYRHLFKLFLLIFLGWVGVVVSRRLTT